MSARNRSNFSQSGRRRSDGAMALRLGSLILFLVAFCFLMGFFVLSRFIPAHGPESPSTVASAGSDSDTSSKARPEPAASTRLSRKTRSVQSIPQSATHPADLPGPSIEPAEDGKIQKPSNIDEQPSPSDESSSDAESSRSKDDNASKVQEADHVETALSDPSDTTPAPRRHRSRRRRRTQTTPTENKNDTEQKSVKEEATQPPARLDDSSGSGADQGDAGGKDDKGNGNN